MTISRRYENFGYVIDFDDAEEALRFVMEWRFGYAGSRRYDFKVLEKWGLPRPDSAPDNIRLDEAIEAGLHRLLERTDEGRWDHLLNGSDG